MRSRKIQALASVLIAVAAGACGHSTPAPATPADQLAEGGGPAVTGCTSPGATAAPGDLPDNLRAPAEAQLFLRLRAEGTQIYRCQKNAAGAWAFTLKAPDARLISDRCTQVGRHFAGPSWSLASDGSVVVGKKLAEAARPGTIPWLLLSGTSTSPGGTMSAVSFIQRVNTAGGVAPVEGCEEVSAGHEVAVPYSATYLYYRLATPRAAAVSNSRS